MKIAESERPPAVQEASLTTVAIFAALISGRLFLKPPAQVSLFIVVMISCAFAFYLGYSCTQVERMIRNGLNAGLMALLLKLRIGMLIVVLCASGTIPHLICLGLEYISAIRLCAILFFWLSGSHLYHCLQLQWMGIYHLEAIRRERGKEVLVNKNTSAGQTNHI